MKFETVVLLMLAGWIAGVALKYVIFGLQKWDECFHPERLEADIGGPFRIFRYPFLGVLQNATCG